MHRLIRSSGTDGASRRPARRLVGFAALAAAATAAGTAGYAVAGQTTVTLTANGPQPPSLTVGVGDTVVFTNSDGQNHSVIASGVFTSPVIYPGQSYSVALNSPGSFKYAQSGFSRPKHGAIAVQVVGTLEATVAPRNVVYGGSVLISGHSPLPGGAPVTLSARQAKHKWTDVGTLGTGADGTFQTTLKPLVGTSYRLSIASGKITSAVLPVTVVPQLTLASSSVRGRSGRIVKLIARVFPANAASTVELMTYDRTRRAWRRADQRPVPASTGRVLFSWPVPAGTTRLRLSVSKQDLQAGLTPTVSRTLAIVGIGPAPQPAAKHKTAKKAKPKTQKKH